MKKYGSVTVFTSREFSNLRLAIPWLVEKLVPAYGINMIYADPKIGKSILTTQLCNALANGQPFLEFKVTKKWKVIYIQADEPAPEWSEQLKVLGISDDEWCTVHLAPGGLTQPATVESLKLACKEYEFVVYDSLVSLFGYPDIKSSTVMGHLLSQLRAIHNGPAWIIHHKLKGQSGVPRSAHTSAAGSFALSAGVSTLFDLSARQLNVLGRVVAAKIELKRASNGLWLPDTKMMLY
jgi:RecA-family ATPase